MKQRRSLFYHILTFVLAQLAWFLLLGLWIYWYVANYIIFEKVGDQLSAQILYNTTNVLPFVGGLILLVGISFSTALIFRNLNIQLKLNNLYDNFIANVTHELKSPLSSIQLYLETLNSREVSPVKQKEFYNIMINDANRLKNLINSILEIAALEQKKLTHDYQVYDCENVLKEIIAQSIEHFQLRNETVLISGSLSCNCLLDKNAFRILFNNLFDNSIKYSTKKPLIKINLNRHFNKIIIDFSDNGVGIPSKELSRIFNRFYRIEGKNIPNVKGSGLGLHLVKEIIKYHGGKIYVTSEGEGKGTTFKIELPIYEEAKRKFRRIIKKHHGKKV